MEGKVRTKLLLCVLSILSTVVRVSGAGVEPLPERDWLRYFIRGTCQVNGIDERVALGVIRVESRGRQNAIGASGELGLMQVKLSTARDILPSLSRRGLLDPFTNVSTGIRYLMQLKAKFKTMHLALLAYNRGPGTVQRALRAGQDPDNGYAARVMSHATTLDSFTVIS